MALQAVGVNFLPAPPMRNPVQMMGILGITILAVNALSNLPMVKADDPAAADVEICKKICEPLPGDEKDAPEKTCNEICTKGGVMTRTRKWIGQKAEEWVSYVKPIADVAGPIIDCTAVCSVGPRPYLTEAGWHLLDGNKIKAGIASAKAGCAGMSYIPGAGVPACMVCCGGIKVGEYVAEAVGS